MSKIWLTSDLHFGHDKEFIWGPRGFKNVDEMNEAIIKNWNAVVNSEDEVYVLGDLMLGDNEAGIKMIKQLKGTIHVILGNHDTATRKVLYEDCFNIADVKYADVIKFNGYSFYLSHYPTMTSNYDDEKPLKAKIISLCGHSHYINKFKDMDKGIIYHVEMESHNNTPILLETIIDDLKTFTSLNKDDQLSIIKKDMKEDKNE